MSYDAIEVRHSEGVPVRMGWCLGLAAESVLLLTGSLFRRTGLAGILIRVALFLMDVRFNH